MGINTFSIDDTSFDAFVHWGGLENHFSREEEWCFTAGIARDSLGDCNHWDMHRFNKYLDLYAYNIVVVVALFDSKILRSYGGNDVFENFDKQFAEFARDNAKVPALKVKGSLIMVRHDSDRRFIYSILTICVSMLFIRCL